ncbi:aldehyde dehydrogenase family protein, partial [Frankia sp. Cpl3]|nr:aldehyde dehydrogenase family protein [Frankia sp. Cpl3]
VPLGVGIVIPPWNFPLAIMVGMTTAALVSGNTVVLKPASTTPVIAAKFMEILEDAGVPAGVVNFVPGSGGEIGDYLVEHPLTRFISFTG